MAAWLKFLFYSHSMRNDFDWGCERRKNNTTSFSFWVQSPRISSPDVTSWQAIFIKTMIIANNFAFPSTLQSLKIPVKSKRWIWKLQKSLPLQALWEHFSYWWMHYKWRQFSSGQNSVFRLVIFLAGGQNYCAGVINPPFCRTIVPDGWQLEQTTRPSERLS